MSGSAARLTAARLDAYGTALLQLPGWVHDSWYDSLGLGRPLPIGDVDGSCLAAALRVGIAPARAFRTAAHRLAALPSPLLCRVLRARGLLRRRPALRHCLDGALRARLVNWVHPAVFDAVLRESTEGLHRDAAGLPLAPGATGGGGADALAWEGFCMFERDGVWTDADLLRFLRLGFPVQMAPPLALDDYPGAGEGSAWVLDRLDRFVAEAPWLCG